MLEFITIGIALLFAANIGASGSAAAMGEAYGSGAIKRRMVAQALVAIAVLAGGILAGEAVVRTLGSGLVDSSHFTIGLTLVVLLSATVPLAVANLIGIPLSTSEVTVGAIVGMGAAVGSLAVGYLGVIVLAWVLLPLVAFAITALVARIVYRLPINQKPHSNPAMKGLLTALMIAGGVYTAFSAGANNVANAVGPLVAAGIFSVSNGLVVGGVAVALGALVLGGRVLETNGKRITTLNLGTGILVTFTVGTLVLIASFMGLPVPLTQGTTGAIMGVGFGIQGRKAMRKQVVRDIGTIWMLSPTISLLMAYFLTHVALGDNALGRPLTYFLLAAGAAVTIGTLVFLNRPRLIHSFSLIRKHAIAVKRLVAALASLFTV